MLTTIRKRAVLLVAAIAVAAVPGAQGRIVLHGGFTFDALDGSGAALASTGTGDDCQGGCVLDLFDVPLDGSAPRRLTSQSLTGVDCPDGDPDLRHDTFTGLAAANEGRALVFDTQSDCGAPRTGQWYAGPYAGPLTPVAFPACANDATAYAISADYEARACTTGSTTTVTAAGTDGVVTRMLTFPQPDHLTLELAGDDLLVASSTVAMTHVTVTDLSRGAQLYGLSMAATGEAFALGDDGTVVAADGSHGSSCPARFSNLRWYSPAAPSGHALPYVACGTLILRGSVLTFERPLSDGLVAISAGDLDGDAPHTITTVAAGGALVDADGTRVLANDVDCRQDGSTYVAPGGGPDDPGPRKCPLAFGSRRATATFDLLGDELDVQLPLRCPRGCFITTYSVVRHGRTNLSNPGRSLGSFHADVFTDDRGVARACLLYRAALADYNRARRRGIRAVKPPAPAVDAKVTGINRDGTTTTRTESLRLELRFTHD